MFDSVCCYVLVAYLCGADINRGTAAARWLKDGRLLPWCDSYRDLYDILAALPHASPCSCRISADPFPGRRA